MSSRFVVCASCDRHVFASETRCPFCESTLLRRLAIGVAGLALMGCPDKQMKPDTDASSSDAAPATAANATEAGVDGGPLAAALNDPDAGNLQDLLAQGAVGDGGLGHGSLRGFSAVYGPGLTATKDGGTASAIRGDVTIETTTATVPIKDMERVLASLRPRFRASYNSGLNTDPMMAGTFSFTAHVAADGSVTSVDAKGPGLSQEVIDRMKGVIKNAQFEAPGKPSVLTGSVVCKKQS